MSTPCIHDNPVVQLLTEETTSMGNQLAVSFDEISSLYDTPCHCEQCGGLSSRSINIRRKERFTAPRSA